jgi:hypothetical protein
MRPQVLDILYSADAYSKEQLACAIAEYCAQVCEEMGTVMAGCDAGASTRMADDCAHWIRRDFGLKI